MPETTAPLDDFFRDYGGSIDDVSPTDSGRKWVVARINTDAIDRFKTVIDPMGMDRSLYLKNPVVLWEHGKDPARGKLPIGRNAWIKPRKDQRDILAKTIFADDEFSRGVFELYRDQVLRGWSINGQPSKEPGRCGPPTAAELRARPELARCDTVYRAWSLTEYSAVAVPGNAEALTEAVSRGLWLPESLRAQVPTAATTTKTLPPLGGRTLDEVMRALDRRIDAQADAMLATAYQDAWDLARGRV